MMILHGLCNMHLLKLILSQSFTIYAFISSAGIYMVIRHHVYNSPCIPSLIWQFVYVLVM